jgi:hypothetical protein
MGMSKLRVSQYNNEVVKDTDAYIAALEQEVVIFRAMLLTLFAVNSPHIPQDAKDRWDEFIETDGAKAMGQIEALHDKATA